MDVSLTLHTMSDKDIIIILKVRKSEIIKT